MILFRQRRMVPEVVQTSAMDCGPAALTALLTGFGIPVSYDRLREAAQTDVDGTSIDALEELALELGLEAEQVMVPLDHLILDAAKALPAIVVVRRPDGMNHFVVAWSRHGSWIQVMDPASGRRWPRADHFLSECYVHRQKVMEDDWRRWAAEEEFQGALRRRLADLGVRERRIQPLLITALADPGWRSLAALDAALRCGQSLMDAGAWKRGHEVVGSVTTLFREARDKGTEAIPCDLWSATAGEESGTLEIRGVVLVRVRGVRHQAEGQDTGKDPLPLTLRRALDEPSPRPGRFLLRLLREDGLLSPLAAIGALSLAAGSVLLEALLFRGLLDLGILISGPQRLVASLLFLLFLFLILALDHQTRRNTLGMGRRLETRLRQRTLEKIPRLAHHYFSSRPVSDMAERSHATHLVRGLPELGADLLRTLLHLGLTAAGVAWLDSGAGGLAATSAVLAVAIPLVMQPRLNERELRSRVHKGALSRFYLEGLMGLVPIWAHGAEGAIRREHEGRLAEWCRAGRSLLSAVVATEAAQLALGFVLATLMLRGYLERQGESGATLLLVYWALRLPILGQRTAAVARQIPTVRNVTLRLLEPLTAPDEPLLTATEQVEDKAPEANESWALEIRRVEVRLGGRTVLEDLSLSLPPGSQVAIVGPSGAGKTSLLGLLLGWHRPHAGTVQVNGKELAGAVLQQTRSATAWVDPSVWLWNRSLLANLRYGASHQGKERLSAILRGAELLDLLEKLPQGLASTLGEGGGLVSGGEGQRVRFGRATGRPHAELLLFDEPFRGLDRETRRRLLESTLSLWPQATLLFVTHDMAEACRFPRALVLDNGRLVEDGPPSDLLQRQESRFRSLVEAESELRESLWIRGNYRRLTLENGVLVEPERSAT